MTTNLIIGGTGKTGRRVASRLQDRGLPVTSLSRPEFDWADPSTWSSVEQPAATAYVTFAPDITFPGAPDAIASVVERMARAGVRRFVLLSGRGEPEAQLAEERVIEVAERYGAAWGVVRCGFFMQNFDEGLFAPEFEAGHLAFSAGAVREPFLDVDDVADVAVAMLVGDVPVNRVYELTGPELMTFAEATAAIAAATGRTITYTEITVPELVADLTRAGFPAGDAEEVGALFAHVLDGHNEHLAHGVQEALGRPARSFAEYAARAVAGGAWGGQAVAS